MGDRIKNFLVSLGPLKFSILVVSVALMVLPVFRFCYKVFAATLELTFVVLKLGVLIAVVLLIVKFFKNRKDDSSNT